MATLTLKKPKPTLAAEKPINNLIGKFAVMRHARSTHSIRFTCVHDTYDLAEKEAKRLFSESQTERYLIVFVAGGVE
jgi:hypothetical protein